MDNRDIDQQSRNQSKNPEKKQQENPFDDVPFCMDDPPCRLGDPVGASTTACGRDTPVEASEPSFNSVKEVCASNVFTTKPKPLDYLITDRSSDQDIGVIPCGECGLFVGAGGAGKSYALLQLAVAVINGGKWFGWRVKQGKALVVMAEETGDMIKRRLYRIAKLAPCGTDKDDTTKQASRLSIAGLAKTRLNPRLFGIICEHEKASGFYLELKADIESNRYDLVVLDPASRFGCRDFEKDAELATDFMRLAADLIPQGSSTTIIVSHHTNKPSRQAGITDQTAARGTSALVDAARFALHLSVKPKLDPLADLLAVEITKNNYGLSYGAKTLIRLKEEHGIIREANGGQIEHYEELKREAEAEKVAAKEAAKQAAKNTKQSAKGASSNDAKGPSPSAASQSRASDDAMDKYAQQNLFKRSIEIKNEIKETLAGKKRED